MNLILTAILPLPFEVYALYETDSNLTEDEFSSLLNRLCPELAAKKLEGKAFYAANPEDAYNFLENIAKLSGTMDKLKLVSSGITYPHHSDSRKNMSKTSIGKKSSKPRRKAFCFSDHGIPEGSEIVYIKDEAIVATVVDDRHIQYKDEITSLSALAKKLLGTDKAVQGTLFFSYQGTRLTEL